MSQGICALLVAGSCLAGVTNATLHVCLALGLSFCGPSVIDHFYCEGPPLSVLSCTDPAPNELGMFITAGFNLAATIPDILLSCAFIPAAVLAHTRQRGSAKPSPPAHPTWPLWCSSMDPSCPCTPSAAPGARQGGLCALHHADTHAEPLHLQPEEPGGESWPLEADGEETLS
ncbi:hypothetical protein DUI87_25402 [Hirundo rustica rustica]|uniref:G-protein coupled receptors family 1 profile domain-containing protein n=1 Tax=Hirundo rustica rustica TaxID=333673 RepID=A0A3M0JAR9_HIRRU|nr:hypothetical protein DUI87_25402 [Hirundo rustica rustica]